MRRGVQQEHQHDPTHPRGMESLRDREQHDAAPGKTGKVPNVHYKREPRVIR